MIATQTQVYLLEAGAYLQDKNGKTWRIAAKRNVGMKTEMLLVDRYQAEARVLLPMAQEITTLVPSSEEAVALVEKILGGTVIQEDT